MKNGQVLSNGFNLNLFLFDFQSKTKTQNAIQIDNK